MYPEKSRLRTFCLLSCSIFLFLFAPRHAMAQCTTSNGVMTCADTGDFTTSGQNLFGTGPAAQISFSGTVGTSWNQSGAVGSIVNVNVLGDNLGDYGRMVNLLDPSAAQ